MTDFVTRFVVRAGRRALVGVFFFLLTCINTTDANAQQTVFNVPSANVAERGQAYVETTIGFRTLHSQYATFFPRVTVGVGRGVELSAGVFDTEGSAFGDTTSLALAGKWRFFENEETGTSIAVTSQVNVPLRGEPEKGSVLTFAGLHQVIKPTGTRVSGGFFNGTPRALRSDNVVGGWASVEQPVYKGLSLVGDWMSGKHRMGAFTPGLSFASGHHYARLGYQIANYDIDNGRNGFVARYGFWF